MSSLAPRIPIFTKIQHVHRFTRLLFYNMIVLIPCSSPMRLSSWIYIFSMYFSYLLQDSMSGKKRKRHLTEERKAKKTVCYGLSTI
jgi:hypothetical protein